jgi:CcmD family protein
MLRRCAVFISSLLLTAPAFAQQPQPPTGFVPVDQLPATESLPAAPLIIAAYAFVWVALFVYLLSIWRRLGKVESEMDALERRLGGRTGTR